LIGWALSAAWSARSWAASAPPSPSAFTVGFLYPLKLLVSFLQAFIFVMLTMLYISGAIAEADHGRGAEHHDAGHH